MKIKKKKFPDVVHAVIHIYMVIQNTHVHSVNTVIHKISSCIIIMKTTFNVLTNDEFQQSMYLFSLIQQ